MFKRLLLKDTLTTWNPKVGSQILVLARVTSLQAERWPLLHVIYANAMIENEIESVIVSDRAVYSYLQLMLTFLSHR